MTPAPERTALWRVHARLASALVGIALLCHWVFGPLPRAWQWGVLVLGLVATGVPHGGADHLAVRSWMQPLFGRAWLPIFGIAYLGIAAAVTLLWLASPTTCLVVFLGLSVVHFGRGDAGPDAPWATVLAAGATPLVGPLVAHAPVTASLFAPLTSTTADSVGAFLEAATPAVVAAYALLVVIGRCGSRAMEWAVLLVSGCILDPLVSFAIYFGGWHGPRHVLRHVLRAGPSPGRALASFAREAAPASLGALALGTIAWWFWLPGWGPEDAAIRAVFIGLAALTVPHMLLHHWPDEPHRPPLEAVDHGR